MAEGGKEPVFSLEELSSKEPEVFDQVLKNIINSPEDSPVKRRYEFLSSFKHDTAVPFQVLYGYIPLLDELYEQREKSSGKAESWEGISEELLHRVESLYGIFKANIADERNKMKIAAGIELDEFYRRITGKEVAAMDDNLTPEYIVKLIVEKTEAVLSEERRKVQAFISQNSTVAPKDEKIEKFQRRLINAMDRIIGTAKVLYGDYTGDFLFSPEAISPDGLMAIVDNEVAMVNYSLRSILSHVFFGEDVSEKKLVITVERKNETEAEEITADPILLAMVFKNLFENVAKYGDCEAVLTIEKKGDFWQFSLKDKGRGIKKEDLPRIFERNYRAEEAKDRRGSGIGLDICKKLVKHQGGEIWAESPGIGEGSTFYFTLPV